ncbi:helix-turn-helix domain-containing protein [Nonomuraea sp. NPDC052634]|uniref:helix-turn-helix domain-containing protein n=1 Tax=Nonomuraea sp. NPDC052634 TaxID=3155813 RepID=UPI00341C7BDB
MQVPLTQDEIANWMGCSRQTVNHALAELVAEGIIESGHPITVRDENLLRDRAFQEPRRRSARN